MQLGSSASLDALCDRLLRATGAHKVLVCSLDGTVVAHAGETQVLSGPVAAELAELAADVLIETQQASHLAIPVEDRFGPLGRLQLCSAPLGHQALLLVIFPEKTDVSQVRVRVRRARPQMLRILNGASHYPPAMS
jgi:predicted regulator of Ras-like GTPase activity (Roadblock/LC7/MglB family)